MPGSNRSIWGYNSRVATEPLPLDFHRLPLGSLYEDRLVQDLLLLVDVVRACREDDVDRLVSLGVTAPRLSGWRAA